MVCFQANCKHPNLPKNKKSQKIFLRLFAGWTGLEPATSAVTGRHSNQLNYQPVSLSQPKKSSD